MRGRRLQHQRRTCRCRDRRRSAWPHPGTMPPPSTRSSSSMPVATRRRRVGRARPAAPAPAAGRRPRRRRAGGRAGGRFLDDAVPGAASVAAAGPFRRGLRRSSGRRTSVGPWPSGSRAMRIGLVPRKVRNAAARYKAQRQGWMVPAPIWIGPSARPWMNWSTIGVAAGVDRGRPGRARRSCRRRAWRRGRRSCARWPCRG